MGNENENSITGLIYERGLRRDSIGTFRLVWQAMGTMSIAADAAYLLTGVTLFASGATPLSILLGILFNGT
jgi:hypothetical protein